MGPFRMVIGAGDKDLGNARAVPGTVDQEHPGEAPLMPELVDLVVENRAVTEGPGRKLEVLGPGVGVGPVSGQEVGRVATTWMLLRARTAFRPGSTPGLCRGAIPTTSVGKLPLRIARRLHSRPVMPHSPTSRPSASTWPSLSSRLSR